jgi:hypothetical protein
MDPVPAMMWNGLSTPRAKVRITVFWPRRTRGAALDRLSSLRGPGVNTERPEPEG